LSQSHRVWRITTMVKTTDRKRNAGASSIMSRSAIHIGKLRIPNVETTIEVMGIDVGSIRMFFLPDLMLYWQSKTFAAIQYSDLHVEAGTTRFVEDDQVPSDATVVDTAWPYVNKDGGPDRRFNNNRQLPVAQYGTLTFATATGLNIHLQTSSADKALAFANCLHERMSRTRPHGSDRTERDRPAPSRAHTTAWRRCIILIRLRGLLPNSRP
jgi:hypothetical protein